MAQLKPLIFSLLDTFKFAPTVWLIRSILAFSAGVGRTGTYIGLDIGMEMAVKDGCISVPELVKRLREERTLMVQAVVSIFLYIIYSHLTVDLLNSILFDSCYRSLLVFFFFLICTSNCFISIHYTRMTGLYGNW